jgi:hypothetical protein
LIYLNIIEILRSSSHAPNELKDGKILNQQQTDLHNLINDDSLRSRTLDNYRFLNNGNVDSPTNSAIIAAQQQLRSPPSR